MDERKQNTVNLFFCGIGGQGVLLGSEITATAAFLAGHDVKKSEVHGMAQRGGSVTSHVRYGTRIHSPLIPPGRMDFLVAFHPEEKDRFLHLLPKSGKLIFPPEGFLGRLPNPRTLNVGLVGYLSANLDLPQEAWQEALRRIVKPRFLEMNREAFRVGNRAATGETAS